MEIKKLFGKLANNSSVQSVPQEDEDEGIDFQRIRTRIKNTLTLPVDAESLGKSSGAATDPAKYVCVRSTAVPKDDLVSIFRRMLDLGSPDYEQQLGTFLHNGPPKMRYEYIKEEDRWEYRGKPDEDIKTPDKELIAAVVAKVKADRKAVDRENKTLVVTKKEDLVLNVLSNEKFDFQCYIPACEFVTNDKKLYERHVVTCHYGKGLCYPGRIDIRMRGWTAQGRKWEI